MLKQALTKLSYEQIPGIDTLSVCYDEDKNILILADNVDRLVINIDLQRNKLLRKRMCDEPKVPVVEKKIKLVQGCVPIHRFFRLLEYL